MPKLSIVIAAFNNVSLLEQCLISLKGQLNSSDTEIFVAANYESGVKELLEKKFSYVKYACLSPETTVPELRTRGILQTTGEIVALAEDHCTFDKNWCSEIKKAHESSYPVIGGSIENASGKSPLNWAVFFYEYGKYMLPGQAGVVDALSGNNVSYKRYLLEKIKDSFKNGFFETFIHLELKKDNKQLYLAPSVLVYHNKSYKFKESLIQCYYHGRLFSAMRTSNFVFYKQIGFILGSIILPLLLPLRIAIRTIKKGRHIKELALSFPYLFLLMSSWSFGEFSGYLFGEGDSAAKWR